MLLTHSAFQDKLTYYVHTPLESLILVALHHDSAWTKFIMKWLGFYCLFFCTPPASRTIASGMLEDMFLLSTFRILLLSCWQAIQITSTGSRNCTHCPPHAWKWFASLAVTFTGVEVRLTVLWVPIHPSHAKAYESFCLCLVLLLSLLFRLQWPVSHVWPTTVPRSAHLLPAWFCKSHSHPSQLSVFEWNSPRLSLKNTQCFRLTLSAAGPRTTVGLLHTYA